MHKNTICSAGTYASPELNELSPQQAFDQALKKMEPRNKSQTELKDIRALLKIAGFSQNAKNRLLRIGNGSIEVLKAEAPKDHMLWDAYTYEINLLLRKMDEIRTLESLHGDIHISEDLVMAIGKLYCLRYLEGLDLEHLAASDLRIFLMDNRCEWFVDHVVQRQTAYKSASGDTVSIKSAIKLIELYRDELMAPPRLKNKQSISDCELHEIEVGELALSDDSEKNNLEALNDFLNGTLFDEYIDELPKYDLVIDWFLATKPTLDKNQVKRGWLHFERISEKWSKQLERVSGLNELMVAYPGWNCDVADNLGEWTTAFPQENPYQIVPLNTPKMLWDEAELMKHCAFGFIGRCISGNTRIFSIRDRHAGHSIATVELLFHSGRWNLIQFKGRHNQDLIHRTYNLKDSLAMALNVLLQWHNQEGLPSTKFSH